MSSSVNYDHSRNRHSLEGPRSALPLLMANSNVQSLLDVGCGNGTWLQAAQELGIKNSKGIDGLAVGEAEMAGLGIRFQQVNLEDPFELNERFDAVLCLEVAEHLPECASAVLVASVCRHSDLAFFSAACPGQPGQNHVNCQWPAYWQALFNQCGFACSDDVRPRIWNEQKIEVWYRQNIFSARRSSHAGNEPRLAGMVHPEFLDDFLAQSKILGAAEATRQLRSGAGPLAEYAAMMARAVASALGRKIRPHSRQAVEKG